MFLFLCLQLGTERHLPKNNAIFKKIISDVYNETKDEEVIFSLLRGGKQTCIKNFGRKTAKQEKTQQSMHGRNSNIKRRHLLRDNVLLLNFYASSSL